MTRKQMQRIVTMMNNGTASAKQIENLKYYADVEYKYSQEKGTFAYAIIATYDIF